MLGPAFPLGLLPGNYLYQTKGEFRRKLTRHARAVAHSPGGITLSRELGELAADLPSLGKTH
jgi:hypothetical protein